MIFWLLGLLEEGLSVGSSYSYGVGDGNASVNGTICRSRDASLLILPHNLNRVGLRHSPHVLLPPDLSH